MDTQPILFDVLIIGAGPAGSTLAYNLKKNSPNLQIALIDKATFPRYKPCGGGISLETSRYFDFSLDEAISYVCHDISMVANGKMINTQAHSLPMVRRDVFDDFLVKKAAELGVQTYFASEVMDCQFLAGVWFIQDTTQTTYQAKVCVLAEGGLGRIAKKLGVKPNNKIFAGLEYEHYAPPAQLDGKLYIDFDYNETGYAWNFPKSDGMSFGIGGVKKGKKSPLSLPQKLKNYVQKFNVAALEKQYLHGHPILLYSGRKKLVHGQLLLIGEIAGSVDPLTAEGIRPSIKSGYIAAQVISQAFTKQDMRWLRQYDIEFHRQIGCDFQYARILSYFLNTHLQRVLPLIASKKSIDAFMELFNGKRTYREKVGLKKIVQMLRCSWFA